MNKTVVIIRISTLVNLAVAVMLGMLMYERVRFGGGVTALQLFSALMIGLGAQMLGMIESWLFDDDGKRKLAHALQDAQQHWYNGRTGRYTVVGTVIATAEVDGGVHVRVHDSLTCTNATLFMTNEEFDSLGNCKPGCHVELVNEGPFKLVPEHERRC